MSQESFEKLCTELRPYYQNNKTRFRHPISVNKQVVSTLYCLTDEGRMRKETNSFGIEKSTVSKTLLRTILRKWHLIFIIRMASHNVLVQQMARIYELKGNHLTQVTLSTGKENRH